MCELLEAEVDLHPERSKKNSSEQQKKSPGQFYFLTYKSSRDATKTFGNHILKFDVKSTCHKVLPVEIRTKGGKSGFYFAAVILDFAFGFRGILGHLVNPIKFCQTVLKVYDFC